MPYNENLLIDGKSIILKANQGQNPIVDGQQLASVLTITNCPNMTIRIEGLTIRNGKKPNGNGGGISCMSSAGLELLVYSNFIKDNECSGHGGGIFCEHLSISSEFIYNIFTGNSTQYQDGGGICCANCSPLIERNYFKLNETGTIAPYQEGAGGAICCRYGSSPAIKYNIIHDNKAHIGGGIACHNNSNPLILNCNIFNNEGVTHGGGISCFTSSGCTMYNCTVADNLADTNGGGLSCHDSSVFIGNCIFWGNELLDNPLDNTLSQLSVLATTPSSSSTLTVEYSDIQGGENGVGIGGAGATLNWQTGNIDADPLFVNPGSGIPNDYNLTVASPCIDAGYGYPIVVNVLTIDMGADERIVDGNGDAVVVIDMGMDEFLTFDPSKRTIDSTLAGDVVTFTLNAGPGYSGRMYAIFAGMSGTDPTPLPGDLDLPLKWDATTDLFITLYSSNTYFIGFGIYPPAYLDIDGKATASFVNWNGSLSGYAGYPIYFAYTLPNPYDFVSNPVTIDIE